MMVRSYGWAASLTRSTAVAGTAAFLIVAGTFTSVAFCAAEPTAERIAVTDNAFPGFPGFVLGFVIEREEGAAVMPR
jgi:hypothetical protein